MILCINSSKVYCKYILAFSLTTFFFVLIVAKCIVNFSILDRSAFFILGINSSKVYCKYSNNNKSWRKA